MLYNINSSGLDVLLCLSVCMCVCRRVSLPFPWQSFTKLFNSCLSFLSSRNTSLHHSSKTPPLLVSQLFDWHAAAYFPQLCLLCPVVLCTLFLSRVSIFRTAQWCIYLLLLTSSTSQSSLFIHAHVCLWSYRIAFITCANWLPYLYPGDFLLVSANNSPKELSVPLYCKYFINWRNWQSKDSSSREPWKDSNFISLWETSFCKYSQHSGRN